MSTPTTMVAFSYSSAEKMSCSAELSTKQVILLRGKFYVVSVQYFVVVLSSDCSVFCEAVFWLLIRVLNKLCNDGSFPSKTHSTEMKIPNTTCTSLFIISTVICNIDHASSTALSVIILFSEYLGHWLTNRPLESMRIANIQTSLRSDASGQDFYF